MPGRTFTVKREKYTRGKFSNDRVLVGRNVETTHKKKLLFVNHAISATLKKEEFALWICKLEADLADCRAFLFINAQFRPANAKEILEDSAICAQFHRPPEEMSGF